MRTALRNSDLFAGSVQPVIEPVCTDSATLFIHKQEFSKRIDCSDCLECSFCCLWQKDRPFASIGLCVIYRLTDSFAWFVIIIGFFRCNNMDRSILNVLSFENCKLTKSWRTPGLAGDLNLWNGLPLDCVLHQWEKTRSIVSIINQLKPGKRYEIVVTNLSGLYRYRIESWML